MRIVFFYPDYKDRIGQVGRVEMPPLGMLSVCAVVELHGITVDVFPVNKDSEADDFPAADVYAYAITASATYPIFLAICPKLKNKAELHIAGNTHVTIFPEKVLAELQLDAVFCGEAEQAILEWISGGCNGRGIFRGKRVDINRFPFPARHLLPLERIYLNRRVGGKQDYILSLSTSRGCPFHCAFCAVQNRGAVSFSSRARLVREIKSILDNYPLCRGFVLLDETFTLSQRHVADTCDVFSRFGLPWECNSRADTLSENIIKKLVRSNCKEIKIGLETGSQQMADTMKKGLKLKEVEKTLTLAARHGLQTKLYILHGFPGENMNTTMETILFLKKMKVFVSRVAVYRFTPLPGSPIYSTQNLVAQNWQEYTIYGNNSHWWGTSADFVELELSYTLLVNVVEELFGKVN